MIVPKHHAHNSERPNLNSERAQHSFRDGGAVVALTFWRAPVTSHWPASRPWIQQTGWISFWRFVVFCLPPVTAFWRFRFRTDCLNLESSVVPTRDDDCGIVGVGKKNSRRISSKQFLLYAFTTMILNDIFENRTESLTLFRWTLYLWLTF